MLFTKIGDSRLVFFQKFCEVAECCLNFHPLHFLLEKKHVPRLTGFFFAHSSTFSRLILRTDSFRAIKVTQNWLSFNRKCLSEKSVWGCCSIESMPIIFLKKIRFGSLATIVSQNETNCHFSPTLPMGYLQEKFYKMITYISRSRTNVYILLFIELDKKNFLKV